MRSGACFSRLYSARTPCASFAGQSGWYAMKVIRRLLLAALAIVVATPLILLAELWFSAGADISQAQRTRLLAASSETAPLSTVERTIAIAEFGGAWDVRSTPCRSVE